VKDLVLELEQQHMKSKNSIL